MINNFKDILFFDKYWQFYTITIRMNFEKTKEGGCVQPLAIKIRPKSLEQFVGQEHLVGLGKPLRVAIEKKHMFSFVLWGPPGVGKTTLARIYAQSLDADYYELSAVSASKEDIRTIIAKKVAHKPAVLFLDEIHRFNKAQQDFLLPYVESADLTLIGATTENPSFEVIAPLLSRCRVFVLKELSNDAMERILQRTSYDIPVDAQAWIIGMANGDARQALQIIEQTATLYTEITIENLQNALQNTHLRYDKKADEHYNTISAFIKSMRASQPNAALYYLGRMIASGEDPLFIARRMVIFASEDIGLANPEALTIANNVFRAVETIGYPECAINLAHAACYLAQSLKSRASYYAYLAAMEDVKQWGNLPIPLKIRNAPTKLMKDLGYGFGYEKYTQEDLLPEKLASKSYLRAEKDQDISE